LEQHHEGEVGRDERPRHRAVDERAIDDEVHVVEAVAEHRDCDRDRDDLQCSDHEVLTDLALLLESSASEETERHDAAAERKPLQLLSLDPTRGPKSRHDRSNPGDRTQEHRAVSDHEDRVGCPC